MLTQKIIISYYNNIFLQLLQVIASIIVARIAGAGVLGTMAFGIAYVSMFTFVVDFGFGSAHIKLISGGEDPKKCLGTYVPVKLVLILAYIFVVIGFFVLQTSVFNVSFESRDHIIVIFILLAYISIHELFAIPKTTYAAYTQTVKSELPDFLMSLLYQILRIIIVLIGFRAVGLAFGHLISVLIILPIFWYMFKEHEIGRFDKNLFKQYLAISLPLILVALTTKLTSSIDKVLLQFFTDSMVVGYYAVAFRFGSFVLVIGHSVSNLFFPTFSSAFRNNNISSIHSKMIKFERFTFLYIMPFVIIVTLNTDVIIIFLLGHEFIASIPIMKAVNLAMFLMVASVPFGTIISGKGQFNLVAKINVVNFIIYLIALIVLIHPKLLDLQGLGAAIGLIISYLFLGLAYRIFAAKFVDNLNNRVACIFIIYGIINYLLFSYLMNFQFIENLLLFRIVFSLFFTLSTYLSLYVFGMMDKNDWKTLIMLVDYNRLYLYIKTEIFKSNKNK